MVNRHGPRPTIFLYQSATKAEVASFTVQCRTQWNERAAPGLFQPFGGLEDVREPSADELADCGTGPKRAPHLDYGSVAAFRPFRLQLVAE